jgi:guanosine-3',5'-bis(diphosphate) 3'-pyrophosphohydrolase
MVDALIKKARKYLPEDRLDLLTRAYQFADEAHSGQTRLSGEPYIEHPLQTAIFLAELKLDPNTLAAALLHDVMEDCDVPYEELKERFGDEVAKLVEGVTKLTKNEALADRRVSVVAELAADTDLLTNGTSSGTDLAGTEPATEPESELSGEDKDLAEKEQARVESLRRMLMSMAEDIRVVLIKLSDRLHNMRTLKAHTKARRVAIAQETLDIYAPLAHRLGIWEIKWRLEDLAFQHLNPPAYKEISKMLRSKRTEREEYIDRVRNTLSSALEEAGIEAEVTGRPKHIYSIYKKTQKYEAQNMTMGDIYDLFALRVYVRELPDCYAALGVVHALWRPLPNQFDDYIANAKDNLYQSLHTSVLCEGASPVEIQIRTNEMHEVAEYGVAAHWLYKEGRASDAQFEKKMTWLRQLLDWQRDVAGAEEYVESFKTDIFDSQVYVYTPKGDVKELPAGSTPLDYAYRIHTDVGNRCVGAQVNGKLVPLQYALQNGDTIHIVTSKTVRGPSLDWLNPNLGYVKTNSARQKIRQWFNKQERRINVQRGKELYSRQIKRLTTDLDESAIGKLMGMASVDELYYSLGVGSLSVSQIAGKLSTEEVAPQEAQPLPITPSGPAAGLEVLGVGDLLTRIARCCQPLRGDDIIGYITRSRGVTVHRRDCPNIAAESVQERLIEVGWGKSQTLYPVNIQIEAYDRVGLLKDATALVSGEHVNIAYCVTREVEDRSVISMTVYIKGIDQLNRLFAKLEGIRGVIGVARSMEQPV